MLYSTWGMSCLDEKGINGMFQVCTDGQNESYSIYFHVHVLVYKAGVQKIVAFKTFSNGQKCHSVTKTRSINLQAPKDVYTF